VGDTGAVWQATKAGEAGSFEALVGWCWSPSAKRLPPVEGAAVALIADPHKCARAHIAVADDTYHIFRTGMTGGRWKYQAACGTSRDLGDDMPLFERVGWGGGGAGPTEHHAFKHPPVVFWLGLGFWF
jgi:hypothetical protein